MAVKPGTTAGGAGADRDTSRPGGDTEIEAEDPTARPVHRRRGTAAESAQERHLQRPEHQRAVHRHQTLRLGAETPAGLIGTPVWFLE